MLLVSLRTAVRLTFNLTHRSSLNQESMALLQPGPGENVLLALLGILFAYFAVSPALATAALAIFAVGLFLYQRHAHSFFHRFGIRGPRPVPFVGHLVHFAEQGMAGCDTEWLAKYGKVYGFYLGLKPVLVIAEPELLRHILVKDFHNFTNRSGTRVISPSKDTLMGSALLTQVDDHWSQMRSILSPAFTIGKMKHMVPLMQRCITSLSEVLLEVANGKNSFDVYKVLGGLSLDIISSCAFAQEANSVRNPDNDLVKNVKAVFANGQILARILIPWFPNITWRILPKLGIKVFDIGDAFFKQLLSKVLQDRKANPSKAVDMLQLLLDANAEAQKADSLAEAADGERGDLEFAIETVDLKTGYATVNESLKEKELRKTRGRVDSTSLSKPGAKPVTGLTDIEIMAQCFIFLTGGYHTTAVTLTFCLYELAQNQNIQDKVADEIRESVADEAAIDYEILRNQLSYLDAVVCETLRKYPPSTRTHRVSKADYEIEGLRIPAGTIVGIPVYAIHNFNEFYADPEKFNPNRFATEEKARRNPYTFLPFGIGPRSCIGMRFALLEIKLALALMLRSFRFLVCEKTEMPPLTLQSTGLLKPANPVWLSVEKRDSSEK